jgi:RHS repeat-associated protein
MQIAGLELDLDSKNRYLYNGKELQDDHDLDWHDYGARMYDAQIGRFHTVDRFSEKYYQLSPYHYVANNPTKYIDINGDSISINIINKGGSDGRDLYQIHVSGKVIDNTTGGMSAKKMNRIASQISKQIEKSFSGIDSDIEFQTTTEITVADASNPLNASDHAFRIVDDVSSIIGASAPMGTRMDGFAEVGQNYMLIDSKSTNMSRTGAHELGHSAGLGHPKDEINPSTGERYTSQEQATQFRGNLMHQSRDQFSGTRINSGQIKRMKQIYDIPALNRGKQNR